MTITLAQIEFERKKMSLECRIQQIKEALDSQKGYLSKAMLEYENLTAHQFPDFDWIQVGGKPVSKTGG